MKHRLHVHQNNLRANRKDGGDRPVVIHRTYKGSRHGHQASWDGPSRLVYAQRALSCGARVWVETEADVQLEVRHVA